MAEPARHRLVEPLHAPVRRAWTASRSDEEARAYLQARLAVFARLVFWSFVALLVFLFAMYRAYPDIRPRNQSIIYLTGATSLCLLALLWRLLLVRRTLSLAALYRIDLVITIGSGATFGVVAVLAWDLEAAAYTCLLYECFTVFTRALVVPSSGRRTAITSALAFVPILTGSIVLALSSPLELPGPAFVGGDLVFNAVAVLLATAGSRIIYGLRRQVSEAMQLGQYTLERKIGEGGMGAVYRAHHALLRRPTAVKLLLPDRVGAGNLDRFEREVQHMSQLTHPNTVAVFDYGRSPDGVLYYAMEYLAGIDLEQLVRRHGAQPADRVVHILAQVCGALQEAHDAGIIHRDIKPANIILCERGGLPDVAKVVDFGLVKEIARDPGAPTPAVLGTPAYIAPEAVTDPDRIGPAVDLYALGAVGYFLVTGRRVFDGASPVELCVQHVTQPPVPPSQRGARITPELEAVILRCLAKQPAERYPSATALADALTALPAAGDWNPVEARRWWDRARAQPALRSSEDQDGKARAQPALRSSEDRDGEAAPSPSDQATLTITVDLRQRP